MKHQSVYSTILVSLALAACAGEDPQSTASDQVASPNDPGSTQVEASEQAGSTVLAEATTEQGATYSFFEADNGDVGVIVNADFEVDPNDLPSPDSSLTALYERLFGEPAPTALVEAEARAARLTAEEVEEEALLEGPNFDRGQSMAHQTAKDGVGTVSQALTASQFQSMYCPGGWDFLYCWPSTGGNPWVQLYSAYLAGAMNATNCSTRFRYRYYSGGTWYTLVDRIASPGQYFWYWSSGGTKSRRWEILNNGGCGVRFSAWGNY